MRKPNQNFVFRCRWVAVAAIALAYLARAEDEPKLEELFPETTLVSIALPNLDAARKAADASRIGAMLKEPEMREFLDPLVSRMKEVYADARAANPMIPTLDELDGALLSGEIGVSLYSRGVGNEPGVVVSIKPKDEKAFDAMLNTAFKPLLQGQPFPKDAFPLGDGPDAPGIVYARGRLLVCKPMLDLAAIADRVGDANKRMTGSLAGSASFKEAHGGMKDPAGWIYLNATAMLQMADEVMAARGDPGMLKIKTVLSALGVDKLSAIMAGFTFAGGEAALETYIGTSDGGPPKGIFALIGSKPVSSEMLQIAAADAPYVAAGSANIAQIMPVIRSVVTLAGPNVVNQLNDALLKVNTTLKFDLEKDLLDNFDSEVVSTQTPHDTGQPLSFSPGMVAAFKLKNGTGAKVEDCLKKIKNVVDGLLAQDRMPSFMMKVKEVSYKGAQIYYFNQLVSFNGSLVLAVVKDQLIYGDSLNAVKRSLDQLASGTNILSNKSLQTALARVSGQPFDAAKLPLSFAWSEDYGGGGGMFVLTMAGVTTGTAFVSGISEVANMGRPLPPEPGPPNPFDEITRHAGGRAAAKVLDELDMNLWPDQEFFVKHRQSHASVGIKTERGWFSRSEFPPPMPRYGNISPLVVVAAVAMIAAVAMPAFVRARTVAQLAVNNNNLRQIHIAITMYENDHGTIPRDPAELYPKYVDDVRVFQNPTHPGEDAAYTYMSGVLSSDAGAVLAYENNAEQGFRNVLKTDGSVARVGEDQFNQMIKATEDAARKLGRTIKPTPISMKEISKKKKE